jgi:uncharacterized protein YllA (UPF0747 family)
MRRHCPSHGRRRGIRHQDNQFVVGEHTFPKAALIEATTSPASFSPNVLLRPIVQDTGFPSICFVAGPNELANLGQLQEVYAHFGVPMPLMYQRATATLADSATHALPDEGTGCRSKRSSRRTSRP